MAQIQSGPEKLKETCMIWLLKAFSFLVDGLVRFGSNVLGNFHALVKNHLLQIPNRTLQRSSTMKRFFSPLWCFLTEIHHISVLKNIK